MGMIIVNYRLKLCWNVSRKIQNVDASFLRKIRYLYIFSYVYLSMKTTNLLYGGAAIDATSCVRKQKNAHLKICKNK